jgi:hypothetical protein
MPPRPQPRVAIVRLDAASGIGTIAACARTSVFVFFLRSGS